MTIASKTRLLGFRFTRAGSVFAEVSTRSNFNASEAQRFGAPFYGVGNEETISYPSIKMPTRFGLPFRDTTAKATINASEFDFSRRGAPFWAPFTGGAPAYNATQFFIMF